MKCRDLGIRVKITGLEIGKVKLHRREKVIEGTACWFTREVSGF